MTLRTEAGDSDTSSMRDRCREPTGIAGFQIALDQLAENLLAPGVEHAQKILCLLRSLVDHLAPSNLLARQLPANLGVNIACAKAGRHVLDRQRPSAALVIAILKR